MPLRGLPLASGASPAASAVVPCPPLPEASATNDEPISAAVRYREAGRTLPG